MLTREQFVKLYYGLAKQVTAGTGLFPQTLLSQAIVESQAQTSNGNFYPGESKLARTYHNYFGIKADRSWKGPRINLKTGEYDASGNYAYQNDFFRVYDNIGDSFRDYVKFLQTNPRYKKVFKADTFKQQVKELQSAGYATNPQYADILTSVGNKIAVWFDDVRPNDIVGLAATLLFFFS